jgi:hypothetical protein
MEPSCDYWGENCGGFMFEIAFHDIPSSIGLASGIYQETDWIPLVN